MSTPHKFGSDDTHDPAPTGDAGGRTPVVFRIPVTAYAAVACLAAIVLMPVLSWPAYCGWLLIIPVLCVWWVARVRTTVTRDGVTVRTFFATRTTEWQAIRGVVFPHPRIFGISWARAHLRDGGVLRLPAVTWNDIPQISKASGGSIPNPIVPRAQAGTERISEEASGPDEAGDSDGSDSTDGANATDGPDGPDGEVHPHDSGD